MRVNSADLFDWIKVNRELDVVMANLKGKSETVRLRELFPRAFDASFL